MISKVTFTPFRPDLAHLPDIPRDRVTSETLPHRPTSHEAPPDPIDMLHHCACLRAACVCQIATDDRATRYSTVRNPWYGGDHLDRPWSFCHGLLVLIAGVFSSVE